MLLIGIWGVVLDIAAAICTGQLQHTTIDWWKRQGLSWEGDCVKHHSRREGQGDFYKSHEAGHARSSRAESSMKSDRVQDLLSHVNRHH